MSAQIIDETQVDPEGIEFSDPTTDIAEPVAQEEALPDKHAGKTQQELSAMLTEAERFRGKQANEVGELRKSVDSLLQAQLIAAPQPEPVVEEEIDFFADPAQAVKNQIDNHPDVVALRNETVKSKQNDTKARLEALYPDMEATVADEAFGKWVKESPIRQRLLNDAHRNYDFDSANELFSTWSERKSLASRTVAVDKRERSQTIKAAGTGSGSSSQAGAPKKMYRRTDIVRLMNNDPERYASMADEIFAAYAEKRVI